ncbi:hypothetical protein ACFLYT_00525 [Nanoarchaeota archaeon]
MKQIKKRGFTQIMVITIFMLVLFLVLLGVYNTLLKALGTGAVDKACQASVIANAAGKLAGKESFRVDCPLRKNHIVIIDVDDLKKDAGVAKANIVKHKINDINTFGEHALDPKEEGDIMLYNAMKLVLDNEMKPCWDKMGQGRLDLFSNWHAVIGYEKGTFSEKPNFEYLVDPNDPAWLNSLKNFDNALFENGQMVVEGLALWQSGNLRHA